MTLIVIFLVSGLAILILLIAKGIENKQKKPTFLFIAISKGDIHIRDLYHKAIHSYSIGKEKTHFFVKKQVPLHSKNLWNKLLSFFNEKKSQYIGNMRNSKLLKKSDGISEFIKNMSDVEKGNGEINDIYHDGSQDEKKELK